MAENMWLKIDGCKGEANDDKHKDEIDVESYSWGMTHPVHSAGSGLSGGESTASPLVVTKFVDKASPNLMKFCMNAKVFSEVLLTCRKRGENPIEYMKIKMKNALVAGVQDSGANDGAVAQESISFAFTAVEVEYTPQKPDGTADGAVTMKWDFAKNKEG
ncbi:MAG TPA: type VI secretion system tube protein Hcp [Candidatus Methylomirabilis sp.]|nr:type VI secretion system tube protein Hcp [Candidatus Methylomirabilis sp.]